MKYFFDSFIAPARAALVSLLGLWLAWSWFNQTSVWLPFGVVVLTIALSQAIASLGRKRLPEKPLIALLMMEVWILSPLMWAALAACTIVIVAVELTPPTGTPTDAEQLAKSLAAAITAFLTSGFISWAGDKDNAPVARRTKEAFHNAYQHVNLPPDIERFVFSEAVGGIVGWSWPARYERASKVQEYMSGRDARKQN